MYTTWNTVFAKFERIILLRFTVVDVLIWGVLCDAILRSSRRYVKAIVRSPASAFYRLSSAPKFFHRTCGWCASSRTLLILHWHRRFRSCCTFVAILSLTTQNERRTIYGWYFSACTVGTSRDVVIVWGKDG